jgi:hypothetical protein
MQIKILTKEESDALVESFYKERKCWTTEEIIADAKFGLSLPGTKYLLSHQYEPFFKWLETDEAREQWDIIPQTQHLARYFLWKHCEGKSDDEMNELITNQIS